MQTGRIRTFLATIWRKFSAAFRVEKNSNTEAVEGASTASNRFNMLRRVFGIWNGPGRPGSDERLRLLEEGTPKDSTRTDAQTQTSGSGMNCSSSRISEGQQYNLNETTGSSPASEASQQADLLTHDVHVESDNLDGTQAAQDVETQQTALYPTRNRVVVVNDRIAFLLTEETVERLNQVITGTRSLKRCKARYEDAKGEANIGQSFIDNAEAQVNNSKLPENYRQEIEQDLERRRPGILHTVHRKMELERELGVQTCNIEFQREHLDDLFEQIMADAGIIDEPEDDGSVQESQAEIRLVDDETPEETSNMVESQVRQDIDDVPTNSEEALSGALNDVDHTESEMDLAEREHTQAWHALQTAGQLFDQREEAYQQDIADHADGGEYSRTDIDLFHFQQGAQLTKNLREAEEEFERTRARAEALGIVVHSIAPGPESELFEDDDGYRESQDPVYDDTRMTDRDREVIKTWAMEVDALEELSSSETPATEWEAESVNMSDSASTCAHNPRQRRWIERWHKQQEVLRAMDFGIVE